MRRVERTFLHAVSHTALGIGGLLLTPFGMVAGSTRRHADASIATSALKGSLHSLRISGTAGRMRSARTTTGTTCAEAACQCQCHTLKADSRGLEGDSQHQARGVAAESGVPGS